MANMITGYTVKTNTDNAYLAPELLYVNLSGGEAEGRGKLRHTGWIVELEGSEAYGWHVRTLSGSVYTLGQPEAGTVAEAAESIREALGKLGPKECESYHPDTLAYILRD
jgi:hypothetical protein